PPAGPIPQAITVDQHGPSARSDGRLAARSLISGLDSTAFTLVVYASSLRSPGSMQDSLLAAGQALPGGIGYPLGSYERFPRCIPYIFSPFPKLSGRKNAQAHPRRPLVRRYAAKNRNAAAVGCSDWLAGAPLYPSADPRAESSCLLVGDRPKCALLDLAPNLIGK